MVHHLNCATLRPVGGFGRRVSPTRMVAHCLLVERGDGLTLVDTGFGRDDVADPRRLGRPFLAVVRPVLEVAETAAAQVAALGHRIEDVTDIVLTHLDLDHAGGLADFPHAGSTSTAPSWTPARTRRSAPRPATSRPSGRTARTGSGTTSPARTGSASRPCTRSLTTCCWSRCTATPPVTAPGLKAFQRLMAVDNAHRLFNQHRVRELHAARGSEVTVFSAHSAKEFDALSTGS